MIATARTRGWWRRRRRSPANAATVCQPIFVGDVLATRMVGALDVMTAAPLQAVGGTPPIWGEHSSTLEGRAFSGDAGRRHVWPAVAISANPRLSVGERQVLPGTAPPPGALNPVLDVLRRTQ